MTARPLRSIESIETPRLTGLHVRDDDFTDLVAMGKDAVVMATLGGVRTEQQTREHLDKSIEHWNVHGFGFWIFRDKTNGKTVGRGGLRRGHFGGNDEVEVAYALSAEFWGKGLATEIARASVDIAFDQVDLNELVAFTLPTNVASRRVMEKAGFNYERDIVHADLPHVLYRLRAG
ncbi:MAG: GNAT family N-acetyltransferase, partial [Planctomycetes bacterium]|nr:GNAT family N-acetyltransferase [Planctomycetota bacterium]